MVKKWLVFGAFLGFAHWFFGNLYEAIVISPNWVVDSPAQLARLHELFVRTSPTLYFVPLTQIATLLLWSLTAWNRDAQVTRDLRRASVFALLATAINVLIVSTIIVKVFGASYLTEGPALNALCRRWNVLNVVRMSLVVGAAGCTFAAFRKLDRPALLAGG